MHSKTRGGEDIYLSLFGIMFRKPNDNEYKLGPISFVNERAFESDTYRKGSRGILLALSVVGIVCLFLFPVPRVLLDILLAVNLTLSLVLLIRGLLLSDPVQLFAFPTLLLISTLFRLGLNISSTRLILLGGQLGPDAAGKVIEAFGNSVVQGDFLVGAIIFSVIALVNFLVITKGAARVAEVSARFSLDALPGKQLAIDSDLRAGNITREEAERRRAGLMRESSFYGSMDGAMRFIQGDAIAGLLIVVINVIGGGILGINRGMTVEEALKRFGVLSIGDGLVSILPSLLVSVCAGVVVTTVSRGNVTISAQVIQTIFSDRLALALSGVAAFIVATLGFPPVPFIVIGSTLLLASFKPNLISDFKTRLQNKFLPTGTESVFKVLESSSYAPPPRVYIGSSGTHSENLIDEMGVITLELSKEGIDSLGGITRLEQVYEQKRSQFFQSRGISILPIRIQEGGVDFQGRHKVLRYRIFLRRKFIKEGNCLANQNFVPWSPFKIISLGAEIRALGKEPISGVSGAWIDGDERLALALKKLNLKWESPLEYLALECLAAQLKNLRDLFGVDETKQILNQLSQTAPRLAEEFNSDRLLSPFEITLIFRMLLQDRVSIRDAKQIFEGILEFASMQSIPNPGADRNEWLQLCIKALRRRLSGSIIEDFAVSGEPLRVFLVNQKLSDELKEIVDDWSDRSASLPIDPTRALEIRRSMGKMLQPAYERGQLPLVVLCDSEIRDAVDELLSFKGALFSKLGEEAGTREWYRTLAFDEVASAVRVETIGILPG